ncbi:alpha/beta hydrolase family esterase [Maribacter sp. HTCC2170]|uniref:alpha/beta hydrolase family esterase n=1 Tax=Maribacter sp. (strain HTCC2170 / KCCM 42371) TaxID=313603 RepID=UPI0003237BA4|nr:PHB depolymerase family esterase [Maribacter sp. HTCC2170]
MKTLISICVLSFTFLVFNFNACRPQHTPKDNKDQTYTIQFQGYERDYIVHVPPEAQMQKPAPLLFHLHGGGGTAKGTAGLTFNRFNDLADRDGFIVVYPNAIKKNWNDGRKLEEVKAWKENIDDVGFIREIVSNLQDKYNIDSSRIFTTGMSNGGFMSSRLLCDASDIFRGGAILTASLSKDYIPKCDPVKPVAVMVMNGTDDPLVPYDGGQVRVFKKNRGEIVSTDDYMTFWKGKNGCTVEKNTIELPNTSDDGTTVSVEEYEACQDGGALVLYKINGGGHTWPGGKQYLGKRWIGKTNRDIVACDVIWDFFKNLPEAD